MSAGRVAIGAIAIAHNVGTCGAYYAIAWVLFGKAVEPGGAGWALGLVYACAKVAAMLVALLSKRLPPLLGMLGAGLLLRNISDSVLRDDTVLLGESFDWWSRRVRACALAVIMLRAGLGIDMGKLLRLGLATARLAFMPCLAEALFILALSGPVLGLSAAWGGTLGFVIAAVSPAVVVPGMLDLAARGYGVAKGVPTMVVAAASFDDVLAIAGFGVCLAIAAGSETVGGGTDGSVPNATSVEVGLAGRGRDETPIAWLVLKAPVELIAGIGFGLACGTVAAAPASDARWLRRGEWNTELAAPAPRPSTNTLSVAGYALLAVLGGKHVGFSGGGALSAIVIGATAARLWTASASASVRVNVNELWRHLQPALFGLLGSAVDLGAMEASQVSRGLGVLAAGLTVRLCVTRLALHRSGLTPREMLLVCVAWLPKATVQAAVGGAALDLVVEEGYGPEAERRGRLVLTLSVLVILLTAPLGAVGIAILGPLCLAHDGTADGAADGPVKDAAEAAADAADRAADGAADADPNLAPPPINPADGDAAVRGPDDSAAAHGSTDDVPDLNFGTGRV